MSIPPKLLRVLRSAGAVVLGYAVIVVCTSVGFGQLGGIVHLNAPPRIQAAAAFVAVGSGLLGGLIAALIAGSHPIRHATAVLLFLCIDTGVVLVRGSADPLWFDLMGAATLMLATVCGGAVYAVLSKRFGQPLSKSGGKFGPDPRP
jgi:hypothetical protein